MSRLFKQLRRYQMYYQVNMVRIISELRRVDLTRQGDDVDTGSRLRGTALSIQRLTNHALNASYAWRTYTSPTCDCPDHSAAGVEAWNALHPIKSHDSLRPHLEPCAADETLPMEDGREFEMDATSIQGTTCVSQMSPRSVLKHLLRAKSIRTPDGETHEQNQDYLVCSPPWLSERGCWSPGTAATLQRRIHGTAILPSDGSYKLFLVPTNVKISTGIKAAVEAGSVDIATSNSTVTVLVGMYQIVFAVLSLYLARGNQVQLYGYASFGLTVIPYVLMTIVNLAAQLFTEDYPTLYMVESDIMKEAIDPRRGGYFSGMVGAVETDYDSDALYRRSARLPEKNERRESYRRGGRVYGTRFAA